MATGGGGRGGVFSPRRAVTYNGGISDARGVNGDKAAGAKGGRNEGRAADGLNPSRQRGFAWQSKIETPTLNDMKAKQGAIVSRFMTFLNRKIQQ